MIKWTTALYENWTRERERERMQRDSARVKTQTPDNCEQYFMWNGPKIIEHNYACVYYYCYYHPHTFARNIRFKLGEQLLKCLVLITHSLQHARFISLLFLSHTFSLDLSLFLSYACKLSACLLACMHACMCLLVMREYLVSAAHLTSLLRSRQCIEINTTNVYTLKHSNNTKSFCKYYL